MIPDLDPVSSHLPPGRYACSLTDVRDRFVTNPHAGQSAARDTVWSGLLAYLAAWEHVQSEFAQPLAGTQLVKALWLAGSFISGSPDPLNADLTVFLDGAAVDLVAGRPGAGQIRRLSDRTDMLRTFSVSPCVIRYRYVPGPFRLQSLGGSPELDYLASRGAFDDFWQRARPRDAPKAAPTQQTSEWVRGYLEVRL